MAEIPQACDFIKVKQFVKKYITWLITQLVVIDIALLTVLFCNCPLIDFVIAWC